MSREMAWLLLAAAVTTLVSVMVLSVIPYLGRHDLVETSCVVESTEAVTKVERHLRRREPLTTARVEVSFGLAGKEYRSVVVVGRNEGWSGAVVEEVRLLQWKRGDRLPCWVNASDPAHVELSPRTFGAGAIAVLLAGVVGLLVAVVSLVRGES